MEGRHDGDDSGDVIEAHPARLLRGQEPARIPLELLDQRVAILAHLEVGVGPPGVQLPGRAVRILRPPAAVVLAARDRAVDFFQLDEQQCRCS